MLNKIIYFENEVPEVYVVESRDFQVLLRLLSIAFNACRVESQQLQFLNDAELINNRLIPLLQTTVGFFTKKEYSSSELRDICRIFMHIVRNKGSRKGIELAIRAFFSAKNFKSNYFIQIVNEVKSGEDLDQMYSIKIGLEKEFTDFKLLEDVLRYVLPTGYFLTIFLYNALDVEDTSLRYADFVEFARMKYEEHTEYVKANPKKLGWYVLDEETSSYIKATDETVDHNKEYFTVTFNEVIPVGTENPKELGWYVYDESTDSYVATTDETVVPENTYYESGAESANPNEYSLYVKTSGGTYEKAPDTTIIQGRDYYTKNGYIKDDNALIQGSQITTTAGHHLSRIQTIDTTSVARAGVFRKENGDYKTPEEEWPEEDD